MITEDELLSRLIKKNVEVGVVYKRVFLEKTIEEGKLTYEISEIVSELIAKYGYEVI